MGLIEIDTS